MTCDFNLACIKALFYIFPNIDLIPCYFLFITNILKKLPETKSNDEEIKSRAMKLLTNIKILCFIKIENLNLFYNKIKHEFYSEFESFFKYFEKNYINSDKFGELSFNYNSLIFSNYSDDIKFYTNNITESFNKQLNTKYIGGAKTFFLFKTALFEIIDLYKNKNKYKPKKYQLLKLWLIIVKLMR